MHSYYAHATRYRVMCPPSYVHAARYRVRCPPSCSSQLHMCNICLSHALFGRHSRASPQQHPGVAPLHHRGNICPNLHPASTIGATHSSFAPLNQVLHTWATCTYRFYCSYVDSKSTAVQRGNLDMTSLLSAHKKPPNLSYHLQL